MRQFLLPILTLCLVQSIIAQNVGIGTTLPKAALNVAAGRTVLFGVDTSGGGSKMIWYPSKYAFRVGFVDPPFNGNTAMWDYVNVGAGSFASGLNNFASGLYSLSVGSYNRVTGHGASALGAGNTASGLISTAIGNENSALADYSVTIGSNVAAKSGFEIVIGRSNTDYTPTAPTGWSGTDRLFTLGNGNNTPSNAMVVLKNGNTGIGISQPTQKLDVNGKIRTASLQVTSGAGIDNILTSDASGNATWKPPYIQPSYWSDFLGNIYNLNSNVGIGTLLPTSKLDINGQLTIDQKNFGGYGGLLIKGDAPGSNYPNICFTIRNNAANPEDVVAGYIGGNINSNMAGNESMDLSFLTSSTGLQGLSEKLRIKADGNVGIGNNTPAYKLDVAGDINASGQIRANGIALSSDGWYKQKITSLPNALHDLLKLRGTSYFFNTQAFPAQNFSGDKQLGLIAEEVETVFPELVSTDNKGYKSVNYIGLIPVLIESIKTLQKEIDKLKKEKK
jgi:hypothetical protein